MLDFCLAWAWVVLVGAVTVSVSFSEHASCCVWKMLIPCSCSPPLAAAIFLSPLPCRRLSLEKTRPFIFCVIYAIGPWSSLMISQYVFVNWIYWYNNQNCSRLGKCLTKQTAEETLTFGRIWAMCRSKSWKRFDIVQTWFAAHGSWEATAVRGTCGGMKDIAPTKIWRDFI